MGVVEKGRKAGSSFSSESESEACRYGAPPGRCAADERRREGCWAWFEGRRRAWDFSIEGRSSAEDDDEDAGGGWSSSFTGGGRSDNGWDGPWDGRQGTGFARRGFGLRCGCG